MMQNKNRFVILGLLGLFVVVLLFIGIRNKPTTQKVETESTNQTIQSTPTSKAIIIDNPRLIADLFPAGTASIERALYDTVSTNLPALDKSTYKGNVRQGSIIQVDDYPTTDFLVDIPDLQQTYRVEVDGDSSTDLHSVYVFCPNVDQLKWTTFSCVDPVH